MTGTLTDTPELNPDGNLTVPKELLGGAGPGVRFRLEVDGDVLRLEPVPLKLYEISDPEARVRAFDEFMQSFAQKTGVSGPEDYNVREDLYG